MYFINERIQVICNQLNMLRITHTQGLPDWVYKPGCYFRPEEADAAETPWEKFDGQTMRLYNVYDGSDQFEGRFPAMWGTSTAWWATTTGSARKLPSPRRWTASPCG